MYTYKTVPAPKILDVKSEKDTSTAIMGFSQAINAECFDGWEFYSMESMTTQVPQGCSFKPPITTTHNMLVFRKQI